MERTTIGLDERANQAEALYGRLTHGRLDEFHSSGVQLLSLGPYTLRARDGFLEHEGGFCLQIAKDHTRFVHVGGMLQQHTNIITIQGKRRGQELIERFRETMQVHPANLAVLLYLELGRSLGHEQVLISGSAKDTSYYENVQSAFYEIPRNYFRLRPNAHGDYECDAQTRDRILEKFSRKHPVVHDAVQGLRAYLQGGKQ